MSQIAKAIDQIVRIQLQGQLKNEGYKKHSRTFCRSQSESILVVNVQASQGNFGSDGSFTLNLGVYLPAVATVRGMVQGGAYPKEYECTIRERIGQLMPEGKDHWWEVSLGTDLESMALEVANAYLEYGKQWLDRMSLLENVFEEIRGSNDGFMAAAVAIVLGHRNDASEIISRMLVRVPRASANLKLFAEKHDLDVSFT